jgi:transposase
MDGTASLQESAQFLLAGRVKVVERLEVMWGPTGRRSWSEAMKARIVAESFEAGARVVDVARRHGVAPQQVTAWRRAARRGKLALPADDATPFAALVVDEPAPSLRPRAVPPPTIEIEADGVVVRLATDVPAGQVAEIAAALRGSR